MGCAIDTASDVPSSTTDTQASGEVASAYAHGSGRAVVRAPHLIDSISSGTAAHDVLANERLLDVDTNLAPAPEESAVGIAKRHGIIRK